MWIFTPIGFFSVVKKEHDAEDEITIRARVRADLEALKAYVASMSEIREDRNADYWYRSFTASDTWWVPRCLIFL